MKGNQTGSFDGIGPVTIAAHELKAPLALLRQLTLTLQTEELTVQERHEITEHMRLVSERALRLTTDLTKAARLEDSLFDLGPVNIQQLCEEVVYEMTPLYRACGRELKVVRRRKPLLAVASRDLLRRIMLNFADNALHYSEPGQPVLISTASVGSDTVRLGVRDFGPALPGSLLSNNKAKLNRPEQIHARPESSGLGLEIAGRFADAMQGKIGATRHRDGASFYVDMMASKQLSLL